MIKLITKNQTSRQADKQTSRQATSNKQQAMRTTYDPPALCIPRGLGDITHKKLTDIINKTQLGEIEKVVIKPKEFTLPECECCGGGTGKEQDSKVHYSNIYIYFKKWNTDNPAVRKYRENIIKGQSIKIVYQTIPTPIFWRCVAANFQQRPIIDNR
jgi:hypothetical protein